MKTNHILKALDFPMKDDFIEVRPLINAMMDAIDDDTLFAKKSNELISESLKIYSNEQIKRLDVHIENMIDGYYRLKIVKLLNK